MNAIVYNIGPRTEYEKKTCPLLEFCKHKPKLQIKASDLEIYSGMLLEQRAGNIDLRFLFCVYCRHVDESL